jgi:hypothetical protein
MNDKKTIYYREVFGMTELLSKIGGLLTIIMGFFRLIYFFYAETEVKFVSVQHALRRRMGFPVKFSYLKMKESLSERHIKMLEIMHNPKPLKRKVSLVL